MIRKIIQIDEEKCNGCGACANTCHEGAIQMIDGKARLIRDDYCDGLGDCLPACPTDAIHFIEREAAAYDDDAVKEHLKKKGGDALKRHLDAKEAHKHDTPAEKSSHKEKPSTFTGCPGQRIRSIMHRNEESATSADNGTAPVSQLSQWPVQIKLAPINAPYFDGANLLIAADCTAYAYADFHNRFIRNRITLIGCPKLDAVDYTEKLTSIIAGNDIKSVTIVRMEVPCCGGLEYAAKEALKASGKFIPWQVVTVNIDGSLRK